MTVIFYSWLICWKLTLGYAKLWYTLLSCEVCDEQFEKKSGLMNHMLLVHLIASPVNVAVKSWMRNVKESCLWMQCSCGVWINRSYGKSDLKINFGWFMRLSPVQFLWEKFVHGVCLKGSYFDVSWTVIGKEFITVCLREISENCHVRK